MNYGAILVIFLPYAVTTQTEKNNPHETNLNPRALSLYYVEDQHADKPPGEVTLKAINKPKAEENCPVVKRGIKFCMLCYSDADCSDMKCCQDLDKKRKCCLNLSPIAVILNDHIKDDVDAIDSKKSLPATTITTKEPQITATKQTTPLPKGESKSALNIFKVAVNKSKEAKPLLKSVTGLN